MRALLGALVWAYLTTSTAIGQQPAEVPAPPANNVAESISIRMVGKLATGVVAIGGETTGATITADEVTWELDLGDRATLRTASERLSGKHVLVEGSLRREAGVETGQRWIVVVARLIDFEEYLKQFAIRAEPPRADSKTTIQWNADGAVIRIESQSGIGSARLRRMGDLWPPRIALQLHLKGLESLKLTAGQMTVEVAVSSTGEPTSRASLREGSRETPLGTASPHWTEAIIVGGNGTIPLNQGYFEVSIPTRLLADNPREIMIEWIDFFRN